MCPTLSLLLLQVEVGSGFAPRSDRAVAAWDFFALVAADPMPTLLLQSETLKSPERGAARPEEETLMRWRRRQPGFL